MGGIGRRGFLRLSAAVAGLGMVGVAPAPATALRWEGVALGARASLTLYDPDRHRAARLLQVVIAELSRLEDIFSLYRPRSALVRLNRDGRLDYPPMALVQLLSRAQAWSDLSAGAFDVTVQPLYALYRDHFARGGADADGPDAAAVAACRARIGYRYLDVDPRRIVLGRPGMAVTLNGIAQGFITDRLADLLAEAGMEHVLADLGEIRALGPHADGRPWQVGLRNPQSGDVAEVVALTRGAVASSAGAGTVFDTNGRFHHLIDPRSGRPANRVAGVTVRGPRATDADALSTALLVAGATLPDAALAAAGPGELFITAADGQVRHRRL